MSDLLTYQAMRMAERCGDCGRLFKDIVPDDGCYIRFRPARLICADCKLDEQKRNALDPHQ